MRVYFYTPWAKGPSFPAVYAIGNFDGLHLGHRAILSQAQSMAAKLNRAWGVITFEPHPRSVLQSSVPQGRLTPYAHKMALLQETGMDYACVIPFDRYLSEWDHEVFTTAIVGDFCVAQGVVVGEDFRFGHQRLGSFETLQQYQERFAVESVSSQVDDQGVSFSSRNIIKALEAGQLVQANEWLGRPYSICGVVVQGQKRGAQMGFPTANLLVDGYPLLKRGVYAVSVMVENQSYPGVANIGVRPTFGSDRHCAILEVHLFDFSANLYGRVLNVQFNQFIRPEVKFDSAALLIAQIKEDCLSAKFAA